MLRLRTSMMDPLGGEQAESASVRGRTAELVPASPLGVVTPTHSTGPSRDPRSAPPRRLRRRSELLLRSRRPLPRAGPALLQVSGLASRYSDRDRRDSSGPATPASPAQIRRNKCRRICGDSEPALLQVSGLASRYSDRDRRVCPSRSESGVDPSQARVAGAAPKDPPRPYADFRYFSDLGAAPGPGPGDQRIGIIESYGE